MWQHVLIFITVIIILLQVRVYVRLGVQVHIMVTPYLIFVSQLVQAGISEAH